MGLHLQVDRAHVALPAGEVPCCTTVLPAEALWRPASLEAATAGARRLAGHEDVRYGKPMCVLSAAEENRWDDR